MSWNQAGQQSYGQPRGYGPNNGQWNAGPNQWQGAGGQYPSPSQPYAAPQVNPPVVGFSDYKAKTDEYGERFKPKRKINDIAFLILFIAQFLGFAAVSGIALNSWISNRSLSSGGVGGSRQGGTNVTLNSHTVYLLLLVTAAGLVLSSAYLLLVRTFTSVILQVTLVLSVVANIAIAVYYWITKYYSGAIIFTIIAVFGVLAYFGMRSRIPLASLLLQVIIDVSKHHKSVYIVAFSGLIAQAALSVWFVFTAIATYAKWTPNSSTCQNGTSCSSGTVAGLIFFELFSYLWTSQVIGNVCLATMAGGAYGGWYYFGPRNMGEMVRSPKNPSLSAFARASTLSLGSIAFGSLIVTLLELLRIILNSIRANAAESGSPVEAALACCAACFVGCIESMVEYFNRYAYIEIALYGKPYIPAAKDTWRLFKDRGIDALINDSLTGIAMTWGAYLVGLLCSLFAYVYLKLTNPAYNFDGQYTAPVLLFAFLIGLQCSLTLASAIEAGVSTIFVGLGEDPQVLAERSPELFEVSYTLQLLVIQFIDADPNSFSFDNSSLLPPQPQMIRGTYPDVVRPVAQV
ncbi:Integral to plasma membrane protein [Ceratobasidium theobromae]|uniref:Protein PNS1 n=1 Tax=Ceratobasidium theobromae TaxID=1582974 RepID=A0A5N5QNA0_9AGAM|nr:Integral to plasma membrane protein [Ceratobasidium theobromae]